MNREAWQRRLVGLSADELRELDALLHARLATLEAFGDLELRGRAVVGQHVVATCTIGLQRPAG